MEQSNNIKRSEVWEKIYKIVKTIPRADCKGMDAPDAPSVATELEELFLKLLPIQRVSNAKRTVCKNCLGKGEFNSPGEFPASVGYMKCETCKGTGFL